MLPTNAKTPIGAPFFELSDVDSTNIYAIDKVQANLAAHGAVFFAHHQFAGKGQREKEWASEPGLNLLVSIVIDPSFLPLSQQFSLSTMAALACFDFFSAYAGEGTSLKWPNDLYWRDRKAAGILIENHVQGMNWQYAIIGIGININQTIFDPSIKNPVSLKQITGQDFNPVAMAKELCVCMENRYQALKAGAHAAQLIDYNKHLFKKNELVRFKKDNVQFQARVEGVNPQGELLLTGGLQDSFKFGEIVWMI